MPPPFGEFFTTTSHVLNIATWVNRISKYRNDIHNNKPPLIVVNRLSDLLTAENSYTCFQRQSVSSKEKADLIIFDPPYFDKKAGDYSMKLGLLQNSRFDIHIKSLLSSDDRIASHFTFQA